MAALTEYLTLRVVAVNVSSGSEVRLRPIEKLPFESIYG
jgi:hypothetical protein